MYEVDGKDEVVELNGVPQSSVGAPVPALMSREGRTMLAYYLEDFGEHQDGASEPLALVDFRVCYSLIFGPPNDEAFAGHPLANRGLTPYGAYEVKNSSWIRQLERMNSVHYLHDPERFWKRRHLIFSFHDSVFECVADGFEIETSFGSMESILPRMAEKLWQR